ncbi:MAG: DUF1877 family protein [Myxococcales bacterium]|nr:DUF1877 family protein [Myxococcales bacterium]
MMKKIRRDNEWLAYLFGVEEADAEAWACATFEFDKLYEETIGILGATGHPKTRSALDLEIPDKHAVEFDGYDIRVVTPAKLKAITKELEHATAKNVKAKAIAIGVTDYYGRPIAEKEVEIYIGDLAKLKSFFEKAAEAGHYLIIAAA